MGYYYTNNWYRARNSCQKWSDLLNKSPTFTKGFPEKKDIASFATLYKNKMGLIIIDPNYGMHGACDIVEPGTLNDHKFNGRFGDDCLLPKGKLYGYVSFWLKTNWHPNCRGHRVISDIISYWIINRAINFINKYNNNLLNNINNYNDLKIFLNKKSGNWKKELLNSKK